jgi:flavin-dependent dehydrogenase
MIKPFLTIYLPATAVITTAVVAGVLLYRDNDPELNEIEFQQEDSVDVATTEDVYSDQVNVAAEPSVSEEVITEVEIPEAVEEAETVGETIGDDVQVTTAPTEVVEETQVPEIVVTVSGPGVAVRCPVEFSAEITVHQLMRQASKQCDFSYTVKEFTSLGVFVDELDGVQSDKQQGKYWIYYVNAKKANVGVSSYRVQAEDVIAWKYEQEY